MDTWTTIERGALLATVLVHLLMGWALSQLLRRPPPEAEPFYTEVVFLPPRSSAATVAPVAPSRSQPKPVVSTRPVPRAVPPARVASTSANTPSRSTSAVASPSAPAASGSGRATLDLSVHTPDVVLIPARPPWERVTTLEAKPTRFAKHWREPKSISQIISGLLPPGGIKDPAQLCSDAERLMQKRGCIALFNRADPLAEEL